MIKVIFSMSDYWGVSRPISTIVLDRISTYRQRQKKVAFELKTITVPVSKAS